MYVALIVSLTLLGMAFFVVIWRVPRRQVLLLRTELESLRAYYSDHAEHNKQDETAFQYKKDEIGLQLNVLAAETNARTTLAQIVGGVLVLLGLAATSLNYKATYDSLQTKALDDRYALALSHLPDRVMEVRLSGIYELATLDRDFLDRHDPAMTVIAAFIRSRATEEDCKGKEDIRPGVGPLAKCFDVQAALMALSHRELRKDPQSWSIDLREIYVSGAELDRAQLSRARLRDARIIYSVMSNSDLREAVLSDGDFTYTDFSGSTFERADLSRATFRDAALNNVNFKGAKLDQSNFERAKLKCAHLVGVDLSVVQGSLTWDQVREADFDATTRFPDGVYADRANSPERQSSCKQSGGELK